MLVVDVLDYAALFQPRYLQSPRQRAVLLPEPLVIDEHPKTLLEAELAQVGGFQLRAEGIRHSVQFHGVQFLDRGLIQHVRFLLKIVWGSLQQRRGRIVVGSATDVFVPRTGSAVFRLERELPVERALQDGTQTRIREGLELQRALAGGF